MAADMADTGRVTRRPLVDGGRADSRCADPRAAVAAVPSDVPLSDAMLSEAEAADSMSATAGLSDTMPTGASPSSPAPAFAMGSVAPGGWPGLPALDEVLGVLGGLAELEVADWSAPTLLGVLSQLVRCERMVQAQIVRLVSVGQTGDVFAGLTGLQARSWLTNIVGLPAREAGRRLRLARQLDALPELADQWAAGQLGLAQVELVGGLLTELDEPDRQTASDILLPLAEQVPVSQLATAVGAIREHTQAGQAAEQRWAKAHAGRYLRTAVTFEGMVAIDGILDPEAGEALRLALQAATSSGSDDPRTPGQRAADAVGTLARHYLATADLPEQAGERPRLVVTIPHQVLTEKLAAHTLIPTRELGLMPAGRLRQLACDAQVLPAVLGGPSETLDLGRASRGWTTAQRRAVTLRDGPRCAHPACLNTPTDLHHIHWWSHGGRTNIDNAAWLCEFHHWLVHNTGWTMRRDPTTGTYIFDPPPPTSLLGRPPGAAFRRTPTE